MFIRWLKAPNSSVVIMFEESLSLLGDSKPFHNAANKLTLFRRTPFKSRESHKCVHRYQLQPYSDQDDEDVGGGACYV